MWKWTTSPDFKSTLSSADGARVWLDVTLYVLGTLIVLFMASDQVSISTVRNTSRRLSWASTSVWTCDAAAFECLDGPVDQSFEARRLEYEAYWRVVCNRRGRIDAKSGLRAGAEAQI